MNLGIKIRVAALGVAMGTMGALIGLITVYSQRQASELSARLHQLDQESIGIAEYFKDTLREVNDKMLRYRATREQANWKDFVDASQNLNVWIDLEKPTLNTKGEKDILQQIDVAYDDYLARAQAIHDSPPPASVQPMLSSGSLDSFDKSRRRLFDLGQELAQAHFGLQNQLLNHANQSLSQLRLSVLGLLGLLFLFALILAVMVYRDMIKPLRSELEESLALAQRREKLASLGLLAAGVAHEIRNPLTAIKAALFIQKKTFQSGSPERDNVEMLEREILRLERIVNDFLQFARPAEPEFSTISADILLAESRSFFAPQLKKNNIRMELEPSESLQIRADVAQLKQVLINLIQNAADSIGRNGTITLRARPDRKNLANREVPVVVLEVEDTGGGISPDTEKRLFDPFFTTKETGTGLGLSIAAQIVSKHGGDLRYETQANRGTTFGVVLPRVTE